MPNIRRLHTHNFALSKFLVARMLAAGCLFAIPQSAQAQLFDSGDISTPAVEVQAPSIQPKMTNQPAAANIQSPRVSPDNRGVQNQRPNPLAAPMADNQREQITADKPVPVPEPPAAYQLRFIGDNVEVVQQPKIFLYYRDFKISRNLNGSVNCSMRFYVLSTLKEKVSNISYRLKWSEIETALAFDDVQPNIATYFDYSLLGNGCYSMDKAPNIIVNRCRVKGLTQRQCADAIEWLN